MLTNSRKNRWSRLVGKYIVFAIPETSVDPYTYNEPHRVMWKAYDSLKLFEKLP